MGGGVGGQEFQHKDYRGQLSSRTVMVVQSWTGDVVSY